MQTGIGLTPEEFRLVREAAELAVSRDGTGDTLPGTLAASAAAVSRGGALILGSEDLRLLARACRSAGEFAPSAQGRRYATLARRLESAAAKAAD